MPKNKNAVALGKMAAGHKKTMSKAALKQRRDAAKSKSLKAKAGKTLLKNLETRIARSLQPLRAELDAKRERRAREVYNNLADAKLRSVKAKRKC